jgi:hypothetical protein
MVVILGMSQRCKRLQYNPVLPTEVEQVPFQVIRMGFDLHTAGLIRAAATIFRSFSKVTSISRSTRADRRPQGAGAHATSR